MNTLSNLWDMAQDRTTRLPLEYAVSPLVLGVLILGILGAVAWLFRKDV